jgi:hypothetical protein
VVWIVAALLRYGGKSVEEVWYYMRWEDRMYWNLNHSPQICCQVDSFAVNSGQDNNPTWSKLIDDNDNFERKVQFSIICMWYLTTGTKYQLTFQEIQFKMFILFFGMKLPPIQCIFMYMYKEKHHCLIMTTVLCWN